MCILIKSLPWIEISNFITEWLGLHLEWSRHEALSGL